MSIPINIPEYFQSPTVAAQVNFGDYIRAAFTWSLVILSIIAVIMLIVAGFQLMTSEIIGKKIDAKGRIKEILLGLLVAFSSYLVLNTINPQLTTIPFFKSAATPQGTGIIDPAAGNGGGTGPNGLPDPSTNNVRYVNAAGEVVIGGGKVAIDYDGSPGAYKLIRDDNGKYVVNGLRYRSGGYESIANGATYDENTNTWTRIFGFKTDGKGQPLIGPDGNLQGVLSYQGTMNGDTTPFVALSSAQLAQARAARPGFKLGDTVILTANGNSIEAIYADNAGSRDSNFSEMSPAAAKALGIPYGFNSKGVGWATGDATISLPNK